MAKVKLTAGRITNFKCDEGKAQAFLWCAEVPGLGVRATANSDSKRYIFQAKVKGQSMRVTIGNVSSWSIAQAQAEARRLQTMIDNGDDPRQVKADKEAAKMEAILAKKLEAEDLEVQRVRESITVSMVWDEYLKARQPHWGARHYADHLDAMQKGGEIRKRSHKLTEPGTLRPLAEVRLIDLTTEMVSEWAKMESKKRPGRARLANRLFSVFLTWCAQEPAYREIVKFNPTKNKSVRELLGKPAKKNDVLQREQLPAWFAAVKQIANPVISAYLQCLLLTGARPNELPALRWTDIDFQWNNLTIRDKIEGQRVIPLTPYIKHLLAGLPRRSEWVFSSPTAASGHLTDPHDAHYKVCAVPGLM